MLGFKGSEISQLNKDTPEVTIYSNGGLAVRQLRYFRDAMGEATSIRIQLQRYDSSNQLKRSIDPRLSESYLNASSSIVPNQQQINTLSGAVLQSKNVDAGTRVVVSDCRGQPLWSWDSRETERRFAYDELRRLQQVYEKEKMRDWKCDEYLVYGKVGDPAGNNNVGLLVEHYDTAGQRKILAYSLLGQVQKESRRFLNDGEAEETVYLSAWASNALGETVNQIDAWGNERGTQYEISGKLRQINLRMKDQAKERILSQGYVYAANGQVEEEQLSEDAVWVQYTYEETTQRLQSKVAKRISDGTALKSLQYHYDPVGNIVSIEDRTQDIAYYKNAKVEPVSHYVYDSLYQLIRAEGVESDQASRPSSEPIIFGNNDASRLVNYQRHYSYDKGGNLYEIAQGSHPIVRLTIAMQSNRGIEKRESGPSLQASFDSNGNLLYINTGQPLVWDSLNQLQQAVQLKREEGPSDQETYTYGSVGNRVQKTRTYLAETQIHTQRVRYLPGLELREHWQTDLQGENKTITERLCFLQVQTGEAVKCLHWEAGRPNELANDAIYFSLNDQIGSHQVEINEAGKVVNYERYYPYGGTAIWTTKNQIESSYKYHRYSGKERDHSGLYYYGARYYLPWLARWLNPDPSGIADGLNLFRMVRNNPITYLDRWGLNGGQLEVEAEQAYDHMLANGNVWRGVWNQKSSETSLEAIKRLSRRNVRNLEDELDTEGQRQLAARIKNLSPESYVLTHFSQLNFVEKSGDVEFLSRTQALLKITDPIKKQAIGENTPASDLTLFATDRFVFFSVDTKEGVKPTSRFGSHRYDTRLAELGEQQGYSHIQLGDLSNIGELRQISPERLQTLPWLKEETSLSGLPSYSNFLHRNGLSRLKRTDAIFYGDQMFEGLGLRIAADLPSLTDATQEAIVAWTAAEQPIENLGEVINTFYRPQVAVPGRVSLKSGQFSYRN